MKPTNLTALLEDRWLKIGLIVIAVVLIIKGQIDIRQLQQQERQNVQQQIDLQQRIQQMETQFADFPGDLWQVLSAISLENKVPFGGFKRHKDRIGYVQSLLKQQGFYTNPNPKIDGNIQNNTRNAIKNLQKEHGLTVTGKLTLDVYLMLIAHHPEPASLAMRRFK